MNIQYFKSLIWLIVILYSCKPNEPKPKEEDTDRRSQFVGTYKVSNVSTPYTFTISKLDTLGQTWVNVTNFANMFDMKFGMHQNRIPYNAFDFESYFPIVDNKFKHKWDFKTSYPNDTIQNMGLLVNNKLNIYLRLRNTPWWGEDDTIYIDKFELHTAIKQ